MSSRNVIAGNQGTPNNNAQHQMESGKVLSTTSNHFPPRTDTTSDASNPRSPVIPEIVALMEYWSAEAKSAREEQKASREMMANLITRLMGPPARECPHEKYLKERKKVESLRSELGDNVCDSKLKGLKDEYLAAPSNLQTSRTVHME
eukprot:CAMPEP_0171308042 /NCGR_PEP_ID=MMETSP0816-20121228/18147_1 /TAXON_ID=420281 /ORGANISM="Proboscia inermis, Strain CCAP1064/1" /LENGTH=147 /DNA_ID=CAMNT_0011790663 /DNA_START=98 /DNA_END=541 /DNA_ORIENTATION=+